MTTLQNLTAKEILVNYPEYDMGPEPYVHSPVAGTTSTRRVVKTFLNNFENAETQNPIRLAYLEIKGTEKEMEIAQAIGDFFYDNIDSEEVFEQFKENELRFCQLVSDMSKEACNLLFEQLLREEGYDRDGKKKKFLEWIVRGTDYNEVTTKTYLVEIIFKKDEIHHFGEA